MFYFTSQRIDLYLNGVYVPSTNAYLLNGQTLFRNVSNNTAAYMPSATASESGSNLFINKQMYFAMCASDVVELRIAPVLSLEFDVPPITLETFFNPEQIVKNFALLLGIPESKIRYVNIVRDTTTNTNKRRRRRAAGDFVKISLTIFEDPVVMLNDSSSFDLVNNQQSELGASLVNKFATGQLQQEADLLFNGTASLLSMGIRPPLADPNATTVEIGQISKIKVIQEADSCNAQVPCLKQPILQVVDQYVNFFPL